MIPSVLAQHMETFNKVTIALEENQGESLRQELITQKINFNRQEALVKKHGDRYNRHQQ